MGEVPKKKKGKVPRRRFYTPYEVAAHNTPDDIWVSFLGGVYDLTQLIKDNGGTLAEPILRVAGTDITHWFDKLSHDIKRHICPITNLDRPYTPQGRFIHVPPAEPTADWDTSFGTPWWQDSRFKVGMLSQKTRVVRIKNVLTNQEDHLEVPKEETISEIRERYMELNFHAKSYTWKAQVMDHETGALDFVELDMNKTLAGNAIADESALFEDVSLQTDYYIPVLHLYWSDDLTVA